ncbi:MAG: hypothetical protein ABJD66_10485 [Cellulophaga sp.]|uniref:hypothetical protein n=1 Tax=Cellulophaga sp. TaxID=1972202 RepID=UPI003263F4FA
MEIKDPNIALETFSSISQITSKLEYEKWVRFIDNNSDYFTWSKNTKQGKLTLANLDRIPTSMIEKVKEGYNKKKALAEFNSRNNYYVIVISFNKEYGIISTTFMKKITKKHLEKLLELANYMDGLLLNNGNEIIDKKYISEMK